MNVDFKDLELLVEKKEPGLMQDAYIAEREYFNALDAINERNKFVDEVFYSGEVKVHSFDQETGRSIVSMDARLGRKAKTLCDCVYQSVDQAIPKLESSTEDIRKFIKKHFRGKTALGFK